jgi:alginate O-acetyltransferase complex protein AlgJ
MHSSDGTPSDAAAAAAEAPAARRRDDPGAPFPIEVRIGGRWRWMFIGAFLAMITLPGVLREFSGDRVLEAFAALIPHGAEPITARLRTVEKQIEDAAWTRPVRARLQTVLHALFAEGNRKVLVGRDGWLFHRPGVQALTGRGPVLGPTHSVAKDPALREWTGALPVIQEFATQLEERGIRLLLVPVPDKAALWSAHLPRTTGTAGPARRYHPDWPAFVDELRGKVEVVDLTDALPYLRDDTHWDSHGARAAAAAVAGVVSGKPVSPPEPAGHTALAGQGDLVGLLGLTEAAAARHQSTLTVPWVAPVDSDDSAPTVVLGDSNVNMYDDPGLPYHQPGAGFASWLAASLGEPLHVIAINGGGATQVRQRFAALPDDVVRSKMTVVWVLAERDLFMDPAVARANGVEWQRVVFNPLPSPAATPDLPAGALVVEATLRARSGLLDMNDVNYVDSVFTAEFTVDRLLSGTYAEPELAVVLWHFRQRVVQPTARLTAGQKVRLTLTPWLEKGALTKTNLQDDFQRFDLPLLYAEKVEVLGE